MLLTSVLSLAILAFCNASPILEEPDCPPNSYSMHPHEDCAKFYVCDNGYFIVQDCPGGLYFNPVAEGCDFPENVPECIGGTRPPVGNNGTTVGPTTPPSNWTTPASNWTTPPSNWTTPPTHWTTPPSNWTTPTPPTNWTTPPSNWTTPPSGNGTTPLPNGCPPEGIDKIPNPFFCDIYFICVDGVPYEEHCAEGLLFNPTLKECDFPENVNCSSTNPPVTTPNPMPECPMEGVQFLPYPGNCTLYYICVEGFPLLQKCVDGTLFDPVNLECRPASGVNCTNLFNNNDIFGINISDGDSYEEELGSVEDKWF